MKRLILLRHGKSDWDAGAGTDHDRPLAERGIRAARTMGRLLSDAGLAPDTVVTSSAVRARTTAELAAEAGRWKSTTTVTDALYGASPGSVVELVRGTEEEADSLLLVGHEPTWSAVASMLTGGARLRFPTAAAVGIDLAVRSWRNVDPQSGELAWVLPPRLFTRAP